MQLEWKNTRCWDGKEMLFHTLFYVSHWVCMCVRIFPAQKLWVSTSFPLFSFFILNTRFLHRECIHVPTYPYDSGNFKLWKLFLGSNVWIKEVLDFTMSSQDTYCSSSLLVMVRHTSALIGTRGAGRDQDLKLNLETNTNVKYEEMFCAANLALSPGLTPSTYNWN